MLTAVGVITHASAQESRPTVVGSFDTAKKRALDVVYADRHTEVYCGCAPNDDVGRGRGSALH